MQHKWRAAIVSAWVAVIAATAQAQTTTPIGPIGPSPSAAPAHGPSERLEPAAPAARSSNPTGQTGTGEAAGTAPDNAGFLERDKLLGDPGGLRTRLGELGVSPGLADTTEVFGNPAGGRRQGVIFEGVAELSLGIDTDKLLGLPGGTLNVSAFQFYGRGLGVNDVNALLPVTSTEQNVRGARLFELWYEQVLADRKIAIRIGQLSADQEFIISQLAGLFINSAFGFPTLPSLDLPSGGPAYPLATPGIRLKVVPDDHTAFLIGVFNGDTAGPGFSDPQVRDPSGTAFRLNDGVFVIAEAQYASDVIVGLSGTYKIGAWYDSQNVLDQRFRNDGTSLANRLSNAALRHIRNDYSVYAAVDQTIWRKAGVKDGGAGVFARVMGSPSDRNLISFSAQAGVTYKGLLEGRNNDTAGLALSYSRISSRAIQLDRDFAALGSQPRPIRSSETFVELTYQIQIAPWWQVQPDLQYIFHPGGGIANPSQPTRRIGDAAILGVRTNVTF